MNFVTLRVLDGADRGRMYENIETPVTIGREEGNSIQLNDDRVSRFHVKIQEDHGKIVLTDLASTNGTQVNGEDTQLRILRHGDLITIGRSVVLYGSREQIAARLAALRGEDIPLDDLESGAELDPALKDAVSLDFELGWSKDENLQATLHTLQPPELPDRLDPVQAAQLAELVEYVHIRLRRVLASVSVKENDDRVTLDQRQWQNLVDLQARLAEYLRSIGDPDKTR
jgi:hypothetical protein